MISKPTLIAASLVCLACLAGIAMVARDFALNAGQSPEAAWRTAGGVFAVLLVLAGLLALRAVARIYLARADDEDATGGNQKRKPRA